MAGDKASSGSIAKVTGCVLLLLAQEVSERQTTVARGAMRPLAAEASVGGIPTVGESLV